MLHVILKYLEVYIDLNYIAIPIMPFDLRAGIEIDKKSNVEDGANFGNGI